MSCDINLAKDLPSCFTTLRVGKLAAPLSSLYVFFVNLATNNRMIYPVATDAEGFIDIDAEVSFPVDQPFEVFLQEDPGNSDRLNFTPAFGSGEISSARVRFYRNEPMPVMMAYLQM